MRTSPAGARFDPLISTHVFGAIVGLSPKAFATRETTGPNPDAGAWDTTIGWPATSKVATRDEPAFAAITRAILAGPASAGGVDRLIQLGNPVILQEQEVPV